MSWTRTRPSSILPASGRNMPTMPLISVVLPAPFGPMTASNAPSSTAPFK
jgi:hypothetical protein